MADAISLASSLIALASFAFETSKTLYSLIESFKNSQRNVRELRYELESLTQALESLIPAIAGNEALLETLKLPLLRCGKICSDFEKIVIRCTNHSTGGKRSIRDWAKLQYMGGDLNHLRTTLAGYKATITIALGGATFRQTAVARDVVDQYEIMIAEATSDLQEHLNDIDKTLENVHQQDHSTHRLDINLEEACEERKSTEQCLIICAEVSQVLTRYQTKLPGIAGNDSAAFSEFNHGHPLLAHQSTNAMLSDFKTRINMNSEALRTRLQDLTIQIESFSIENRTPIDVAHLQTIKEERDSILQCLEVCADASNLANRARTNIFENVTSSDDAHQLVVSTIGDLISAKHIITGNRSAQWLGQMSDNTLQQMSRDFTGKNIQERDSAMTTEKGFEGRYGNDIQLYGEGYGKSLRSGYDNK